MADGQGVNLDVAEPNVADAEAADPEGADGHGADGDGAEGERAERQGPDNGAAGGRARRGGDPGARLQKRPVVGLPARTISSGSVSGSSTVVMTLALPGFPTNKQLGRRRGSDG